MDNNISFQSDIRLVPNRIFNRAFANCKNKVPYPWTVKEVKFAPKAGTTDVYDCTAGGVSDGDIVMFFHFCPTEPKNFIWSKIENFLVDGIVEHLNPNYLSAVIMGSKPYNINSPNSTKLFDFLENVYKRLNIPYSKFKGGNYENNLLYNSSSDQWIIGNYLLDDIDYKTVFKTPMDAARRIFDEVKIADCDTLTW